MTENEFRQEMHQYIDQKYSLFNDYKQKIYLLLDQFHEFCKKNGLRYFVAYGSLLGEIRDGGQIPWDYDMDVCMPLNDYQRFKKIFLKDNSNLLLEDNFGNKKSPFYEARLGFKDAPLNLVHLDIFYCVGLPENIKKEVRFRKRLKKMFILKMHKSYLKYKKNDKNRKIYIGRKIYYALEWPFLSLKRIDKIISKLANKFDYDKASRVIPINFIDTPYNKQDIEPISTVLLHGKEMMMPSNPVGILQCCYKNYQLYLPIDSRFKEFYSWIEEYNSFIGNNEEDYRK